jgi:hypothetical protein
METEGVPAPAGTHSIKLSFRFAAPVFAGDLSRIVRRRLYQNEFNAP